MEYRKGYVSLSEQAHLAKLFSTSKEPFPLASGIPQNQQQQRRAAMEELTNFLNENAAKGRRYCLIQHPELRRRIAMAFHTSALRTPSSSECLRLMDSILHDLPHHTEVRVVPHNKPHSYSQASPVPRAYVFRLEQDQQPQKNGMR